MNKKMIYLKSTKKVILENKAKYPKYSKLMDWLKNNYKKENFYLTVNEIEMLVNKIANFSRIYEGLNVMPIVEKNGLLLNKNELETLQCHYRYYTVRHSSFNHDINENKASFWNELISLSITVDGEERTFCITPDGIVKESDLENCFASKIDKQKANITLDTLYTELLGSNTINCDYSEIRECLCIHYDDLILKRMIWDSVTEQLNSDKEIIQKVYNNQHK